MAKKEADVLSEIKNYVKGKKLVIGTEGAIRAMRAGKVEKIFLSSNCPSGVRADIEHYGKIGGIKIENLAIPNDELGVVCKKQFSISVLGLLATK